MYKKAVSILVNYCALDTHTYNYFWQNKYLKQKEENMLLLFIQTTSNIYNVKESANRFLVHFLLEEIKHWSVALCCTISYFDYRLLRR